MRNGILMSSSYHVDEVNKVVICTLKCDMQFEKHPAYFHVYTHFYNKKFPFIKFGEFEVKAKARCNAIDDFNIETGKRIAESRAKAKAFRTAGKVWKEIIKFLTKAIETCNYTVKACEKAECTENAHIEKLMK